LPANDVTVIGNHLHVPVTVTDDPACGNHIGWYSMTITWRAWSTP
jgi:hypothetical protein